MTDTICLTVDSALTEKFRALAGRRGVSLESAAGEAASLGATLLDLEATVRSRWDANPAESYAARLLRGPEDSLLKKLVEEAAEAALAAKAGDREGLARETADLWFHSIAALARYNSDAGAVAKILAARAGQSGVAEKAARQE